MRFPAEYTCNLMNEARHAAFGKLAAKMVLQSLAADWPKVVVIFVALFFFLDITRVLRLKKHLLFPFRILVLIV